MKIDGISVDEIVARRKDLSGDKSPVVKAARAASTWDGDKRTARFIMSAQSVDRMGDIVVTEGIDTTQFEANPVALLMHNSRSWPIGTWANLEKNLTGRPKRLEGDLVLLPAGGPVKEIDETEWMLANGGIKAASIGFVPDWNAAELIKDESGDWTGGIKWNKSELVECSVVPVPANPDALARSVGGDLRIAKEFIEDVLDSWAKTPEGVIVPRAEYEKSYFTVKGATIKALPISASDTSTFAITNGIIVSASSVAEPPPSESAVAPDGVTADLLRLRKRRLSFAVPRA